MHTYVKFWKINLKEKKNNKKQLVTKTSLKNIQENENIIIKEADKGSYRTLHSYKLFWAVCHLFPQRWRTLNIQSRETIGQEDHVICLKLRRRA